MRATELRYALALAREAGEAAASSTRRIALRNNDPDDTGAGWRHRLGPTGVPGPAVTGEQVRSTCADVDEFSSRLTTVNEHLERHGAEPIDTLSEASSALWSADRPPAEVHNDINRVLAELERLRIAVVLGRPLDPA